MIRIRCLHRSCRRRLADPVDLSLPRTGIPRRSEPISVTSVSPASGNYLSIGTDHQIYRSIAFEMPCLGSDIRRIAAPASFREKTGFGTSSRRFSISKINKCIDDGRRNGTVLQPLAGVLAQPGSRWSKSRRIASLRRRAHWSSLPLDYFWQRQIKS